MYACMHACNNNNCCISLQKTPKQWVSKYANHSCWKTTNHSRQCVLLCGWNNLIYTIRDDNVRQMILLILIGFHKLLHFTSKDSKTASVRMCPSQLPNNNQSQRHCAFLYSWNGVVYTTNYDKNYYNYVKKVQKQSSTPLHIKKLFPELHKDGF